MMLVPHGITHTGSGFKMWLYFEGTTIYLAAGYENLGPLSRLAVL